MSSIMVITASLWMHNIFIRLVAIYPVWKINGYLDNFQFGTSVVKTKVIRNELKEENVQKEDILRFFITNDPFFLNKKFISVKFFV